MSEMHRDPRLLAIQRMHQSKSVRRESLIGWYRWYSHFAHNRRVFPVLDPERSAADLLEVASLWMRLTDRGGEPGFPFKYQPAPDLAPIQVLVQQQHIADQHRRAADWLATDASAATAARMRLARDTSYPAPPDGYPLGSALPAFVTLGAWMLFRSTGGMPIIAGIIGAFATSTWLLSWYHARLIARARLYTDAINRGDVPESERDRYWRSMRVRITADDMGSVPDRIAAIHIVGTLAAVGILIWAAVAKWMAS